MRVRMNSMLSVCLLAIWVLQITDAQDNIDQSSGGSDNSNDTDNNNNNNPDNSGFLEDLDNQIEDQIQIQNQDNQIPNNQIQTQRNTNGHHRHSNQNPNQSNFGNNGNGGNGFQNNNRNWNRNRNSGNQRPRQISPHSHHHSIERAVDPIDSEEDFVSDIIEHPVEEVVHAPSVRHPVHVHKHRTNIIEPVEMRPIEEHRHQVEVFHPVHVFDPKVVHSHRRHRHRRHHHHRPTIDVFPHEHVESEEDSGISESANARHSADHSMNIESGRNREKTRGRHHARVMTTSSLTATVGVMDDHMGIFQQSHQHSHVDSLEDGGDEME